MSSVAPSNVGGAAVGNAQAVANIVARKMPKPGERNAPSFDPDKPEELGRFFDRIEDWYAEEDITDDAEMKRRIVKYLDADSEIQWKAFSKFKNGTFLEFKTQVMAAYPKAEEVMKGSMTALKRKLNKHGPIALDERHELLALIRAMTAEVGKLKGITPPIHTNRELVDLFLGRLTPAFANRVANKLSVHRVFDQANPGPGMNNRNPEDMYDIDEVMEVANSAAMENANPFGKFLTASSQSGYEPSVKLEEAVARLTDTINLQTQHNKQVEQKLSNLQNFMNQPKPFNSGGYAAQSGYNRGLVPASNPLYQPQHNDCFYCRGPHRILECEQALKHLDLGWIKKIDNQLRLPDGTRIPREGNKTMMDVVESMYKSRPGIIPMSKIQDKSSFYQESSSASNFIQNQAQPVEESNLRNLLELIQKVGPDQIQRLLDHQSQLKDEDEWNQNFE